METDSVTKSLCNLKALGFSPKNTLDIGACIGKWTKTVRESVFPGSNYLLIEPIKYHQLDEMVTGPGVMPMINVANAILSDNIKEVTWYEKQNTGDSLYRENTRYYSDCIGTTRCTMV